MLLFIHQLCPTLCYPMDCNTQASVALTISWSLLELMSTESEIPSNYLILCRPLLILSSIFSSIRVFSSEPALSIRWPKNWSFVFSISPSNGYSGFVSRSLCSLNKCRRLMQFLCDGLLGVLFSLILQCRRPGFNPWSVRSPGKENGNPL